MEFKKLADYLEKIEKASSRLEMTDYLSELLKESGKEDVDKVVYLCQGKLGPAYLGLDIGLGENLVEECLAKASGYVREEINGKYKELGDLGLVAAELVRKKKQQSLFSEKLSVDKVYQNFLKMAKTEGHGSQETKLKLLAELLNSSTDVEAKFIVRIPLGTMRLGIGDPTLMDSLAINYSKEFVEKEKKIVQEIEKELKEKKEEKRKEEFERKIKMKLREEIEDKYNIYPDLGKIAKMLKEKGLKGIDEIEITPGVPIRPTMAERLPDAEEILKKIGECAVEGKFDGFRVQVHKHGEKVTIFSRRSENMTEMFPEIVEAAKEQINAKNAIVEGEALAMNEDTGEYYPFQVTIQRKRKYEIGKKAEELPLKLFVFDVMLIDKENLMFKPFRERRERLKKLLKEGKGIELTPLIITNDAKKINEFFDSCVEKGLEGIIAKDLNEKYIAGARKFAWIKLKRSYKGELQDSVDVVIIGYFKGRGQRTQFGLGTLLTAVYDEASDSFKSIAKVGSGLTEEKMEEYEKMLQKIKTPQKAARVESEMKPDVWVEPKYVAEVIADEITKSPIHLAGKDKAEGYALRFPRIIKLRQDKKPEEATTVKEIKEMFKLQKHVKNEVFDEKSNSEGI